MCTLPIFTETFYRNFLFVLAYSQKHPVYADSVESSSLSRGCVGSLLAASACYPAGSQHTYSHIFLSSQFFWSCIRLYILYQKKFYPLLIAKLECCLCTYGHVVLMCTPDRLFIIFKALVIFMMHVNYLCQTGTKTHSLVPQVYGDHWFIILKQCCDK